jgi:hypothetical protein
MENHARSIFGARSIGYYCLAGDSLPDEAAQVASHLWQIFRWWRKARPRTVS